MSFDEETFALNRILQPPTRFILNINMFLASFSELNPKIDARNDNPVSSFERTERERELLAGNGYHPISVTNNSATCLNRLLFSNYPLNISNGIYLTAIINGGQRESRSQPTHHCDTTVETIHVFMLMFVFEFVNATAHVECINS